MANNWQINAIAGLDGTQSRNQLNSDIKGLARNLDKLKLYTEIDKNQVTQLQHQLKNLQVQLNNVTVSDAVINGLVAKINAGLQNVNISNVNIDNIGNQARQTGEKIAQQINQGINSVVQKGSFEKIFTPDKNGINGVAKDAEKYFKTLSNTVSVEERLGNKNNLEGFTVTLKNAEGVVEQLRYKYQELKNDAGEVTSRWFEYSGGSINDNGVIKQMNAISAKADSLQTKLDKLKANYSDVNASRPIKDSGNISALSQQYDKVTQAIENVRSADNATFSSMVSNAQREITTLESMVSQFRNAENVATQMKSVDISSGIAQAQERLGKLKANASGFEQMTETIRKLDTAIESVGDKSSLDKFINDLRTAETQLGRVKAETKAIENTRKKQESLTNAMAKGREQAELSRQAEQKRQQMAQNNAINKALEQEYQERQKNIEAAKKQAELDKQNALAFTKSASERLSSAISKYSYGDTSDANAMMKQMNRGLSNFGDLSNVQGNITQLSSTVDKIIADLKVSHEQSLQALNEEIKAEQTLQSQKDAFNKKNINAIDYEIQKREEEAKAFSSMLQAQMQEQQKMQSELNKIQLSFDNGHGASEYQNRITKITQDFEKYGLSADEASKKTENLRNILSGFKTVDGKFLPDEQLLLQADKLEQEFEAVKISVDQAKLAYDKFAQPVSNEKAFSLINRINTFLAKNTAISSEARVQLQGFVSILEKGVNLNKWNEIDKAFKKTENKMRGLGKLGASLSQQFQQAAESFTQWISVSSGIMFIVHQLKKAVSELKEIDTLITEISKANDKLSSSQLAEISDNSFDVASKYGKKATDYLSAVQESSRAGYKNAEAIAELSTAIQGAGDVTSDIANKYVIATDKAYGLKGSVEELTKVFDGSNYITNKNAVNMTELAEGMSIVGSTAASFGIEANETTAALGTMIATTQQSGSEMARAFRAVLLNIRQVSDEEEGIDAEGLTKYEEACNALGVSLKETRNGVLQTRDAMDVLKELSIEYNKLEEGDLRRTQLLNSVGGKSLPRYIEIYN